MWRRLSDDTRNMFLGTYKFEAYLIRITMGIWILFAISIEWILINDMCIYIAKHDILNIITGVFGIAFIFLMGLFLPVHFIRTTGTEEIKALQSGEALVADGFFVSSRKVYRGKRKSKYYETTVRIIDEYGNAFQTVTCRSIGNMGNSCKEGDRVLILMPNLSRCDELICMKTKM